jgi:hypothetical protein
LQESHATTIQAVATFCSVRCAAVRAPIFSEIIEVLYNNCLVDRNALIKWHLNCTRDYSKRMAQPFMHYKEFNADEEEEEETVDEGDVVVMNVTEEE